MKLHITVFPVLFFAGVLLANLRWTNESFWLGYQMQNALRQLPDTERSWFAFPAFLLKYRLPVWTALCFCSCFYRGELVLLAFSGWLGLSLGLLSAALAGQFSLFGILLFCMLLFPQIFAYFPAYICLLNNGLPASGSARRVKHARIPVRIIISGLFFAGVSGEYFLNPWFIQKAYSVFGHFLSIQL